MLEMQAKHGIVPTERLKSSPKNQKSNLTRSLLKTLDLYIIIVSISMIINITKRSSMSRQEQPGAVSVE